VHEIRDSRSERGAVRTSSKEGVRDARRRDDEQTGPVQQRVRSECSEVTRGAGEAHEIRNVEKRNFEAREGAMLKRIIHMAYICGEVFLGEYPEAS
jgi:hypothetical protein